MAMIDICWPLVAPGMLLVVFVAVQLFVRKS